MKPEPRIIILKTPMPSLVTQIPVGTQRATVMDEQMALCASSTAAYKSKLWSRAPTLVSVLFGGYIYMKSQITKVYGTIDEEKKMEMY